MKWSYSSLKQYQNCPKQFYEVKVAKNFIAKDTKHTIYGKEVHKAIENYILSGEPFPKNYRTLLAQVPPIIELLSGEHHVELKMAIDDSRNICSFYSDRYWVRGIADLIAVLDDQALIVDWKTGSDRYADTKQLTLMALLTFVHFPNVNLAGGMLYFTKNKRPVFSDNYGRKDMDEMWKMFDKDLELLDMSFQANNWPMQPSGLCSFCPVETCVHWRE